ncbi:hypothetical protein GCM10010266_57850 [Streptomyces griseomycini]|nr:hypothetical protein GCM10010266_57850 [Streptomyces griseomycini]GGR46074.1 hypothetical protein GCM10015536_59850 [Streptomyces griseomycini]
MSPPVQAMNSAPGNGPVPGMLTTTSASLFTEAGRDLRVDAGDLLVGALQQPGPQSADGPSAVGCQIVAASSQDLQVHRDLGCGIAWRPAAFRSCVTGVLPRIRAVPPTVPVHVTLLVV